VTTGRWGALEDRYVRGVSRLLLGASLGAAACAVVIGSLLARGMTRPLQALTTATRQLTLPEGSRWAKPPVALPVTARDEVGELTGAFNLMVAELSRQENLRRRMVGDIAHELRTPLSVLKIELEALEDGVVAPAPAAIVSLKEEVDLLGRLVDDLQLLSLAEAGQLSLAVVSLEPATVLARSAARAVGRAKQRRIDIRVEASPGLSPIHADEQRLAQALDNLIENALRYTPPGGHITLSCRTSDGEIHFVVRDTGPGIPTADLERIFDHFYRTDRARARHTGGTGLGLAIVRSLMAAMGGRVYVQSPPNPGATFVLALPARNSPSDKNGHAIIA
jgi:signal transduction histidine kinase